MNSPEELKLALKVSEAQKELEISKKRFFAKRRELDDSETLLVEARESLRKAEEELYVFRSTKVGETSLEDHRDWQVADYKTRMPELMKQIEHEKPMKPATISDLDTTSAPGYVPNKYD